jgi:uncharacterized membrane protein YcaP (DUF421 family)
MRSATFFFDGWAPVHRTVVVGGVLFVTLVVVLRSTGSRSLSRLNAFDFVVTVPIGATFGGALISTGVALADAVAAFAVLLVVQFLVGFVQPRWPRFKRFVTNPPRLLYYRGTFLRGETHKQPVVEHELRAVTREAGIGSLGDVEAIVLESGGELSVVTGDADGSAMGDLPLEDVDALLEKDAASSDDHPNES